MITYPASLVPPQKMCYRPSVFFYPKKLPSLSTHELPLYGDSSIPTLIGQFGRDLPAKSLEGIKFEKAATVSSDLITEWNTFHQLLIKQPEDDISMHIMPRNFRGGGPAIKPAMVLQSWAPLT